MCLTWTPGNFNEIGQDKQRTPDLFVHIDERRGHHGDTKGWLVSSRVAHGKQNKPNILVDAGQALRSKPRKQHTSPESSRMYRTIRGEGRKSPRKQARKRKEITPPQEGKGGRGGGAQLPSSGGGSRRRLVEYWEEKGLPSSGRRAAPSTGLSEALDRRYLWRNCCASGTGREGRATGERFARDDKGIGAGPRGSCAAPVCPPPAGCPCSAREREGEGPPCRLRDPDRYPRWNRVQTTRHEKISSPFLAFFIS